MQNNYLGTQPTIAASTAVRFYSRFVDRKVRVAGAAVEALEAILRMFNVCTYVGTSSGVGEGGRVM